MTGPEHYRAAESWRETARDQLQDDEPKAAELALRFAQVHATLALAAATALQDSGDSKMYYRDFEAWTSAAGEGMPSGPAQGVTP